VAVAHQWYKIKNKRCVHKKLKHTQTRKIVTTYQNRPNVRNAWSSSPAASRQQIRRVRQVGGITQTERGRLTKVDLRTVALTVRSWCPRLRSEFMKFSVLCCVLWNLYARFSVTKRSLRLRDERQSFLINQSSASRYMPPWLWLHLPYSRWWLIIMQLSPRGPHNALHPSIRLSVPCSPLTRKQKSIQRST